MNFLPIMIMNAILLVITILLSIADRFLVNYGACKITVTQEDEKKEFVVEGGGYLHAALIENDFRLTTSCGGKATCGYCKVNVLNGGGPILPTEEIFMSRKEKAFGIRLACQVKVKEDIEIFIPDFLTIVRNMVENRTYDSKLRWRFIKGDPGERISEKETMKLSHEDNLEIQGIIEDCKDMEGALVPILQKVNHRFNYLPEPVFGSISESLNIPVSALYRIATFYNAFSLVPRGKYAISVCLGTACYVKGGQNILEAFERELNIEVGGATEDLKFSLETVSCLGCCGQSPVVAVNEDIYGYVKQTEVAKIIKRYE
ncbi:MAG: NAD(P)H-dependent oxidoreductase subunit E [Candidatus Latescibacteria bacterium]|nr:NAD(P)H-dependent oxidoreductase subunit E [Candidatus Latescibacterota bacterium]